MIRPIQLLHFAMTALRDLEAGYPPREIASPVGVGLQSLVGEIANQLSALGALDVNDRQGLVAVFPDIEIQKSGFKSDSRSKLLEALVGDGLHFAYCLKAYSSEPDNSFVQVAREHYASGSDGDIDLDDRPVLSISDDGAYVLGWLWVSNEDAGISREDEKEDADASASLSPIPNPLTDKSISDDDLCSDCKHCTYRPGETSACAMEWPGLIDSSGYVRKCDAFEVAETQQSDSTEPRAAEPAGRRIRTSELVGAALDWAVAKCEEAHDRKLTVIRREDQTGWPIEREVEFDSAPKFERYSPSRLWAQGGVIIEREGITVFNVGDGAWAAAFGARRFSPKEMPSASTALIAALRCYVASKMGEEVEIPNELEVA